MIYYVIAGFVVLIVAANLFLHKIWFYRDPPRNPERDEPGVIIAPASGRVVYIRKFEDGKFYSEKLGEYIHLPEITGCDNPERRGWGIGIYMSPLDVHFNYCPYPGTVDRIHRKSGSLNLPMLDLWEYIRVVWLRKMVDMFARKYHLTNERNTIFLTCSSVKMAVVLIADKFVSKIKCFVEPDQRLAYSEKLGFIERGSQVDLIVFADDVEWEVEINQQVHGGQTVIGKLPADSGVCAAVGLRQDGAEQPKEV
jgi:phosphatidylserine decarboxylase